MLTPLGPGPVYGVGANPRFADAIDLGLGRWVVLEYWDGIEEPVAKGVFRYGQWEASIAPAIYVPEGVPGGTLSREGTYRWRAPYIGPNLTGVPTAPQRELVPASFIGLTDDILQVDMMGPGVVAPYGPNGGPGNLSVFEEWSVLDGSPSRWASVGVIVRHVLARTPPIAVAVPVSAGIHINGQMFESSAWMPFGAGSAPWAGVRASWVRASAGDAWLSGTHDVSTGMTVWSGSPIEIGLGARWAVAVSLMGSNTDGTGRAEVLVADRSSGAVRAVVIDEGEPFSGPVVRGNSAIFYLNKRGETHCVIRIILDLSSLSHKTEIVTQTRIGTFGTYAPSYMTDAPCGTSDPDYVKKYLDMDGASVALTSGGDAITYSGNNLVVRTAPGSSRGFQPSGANYLDEVFAWSPDGNLADGGRRGKGYFV